MRPVLTMALAFAVLAAALPATAQNAGQISLGRGGSSCAGCNLFQADLSGMEARGLNLSGARLRQADLSVTTMNRARFSNADLRDVEAYGGVFSSSSFVGAYLEGVDFSGAILTGANLSGASLVRASGLTQGRLNQACGDEATRLPGGLFIPCC
ncbi:pentapeptide repeat-containing protein [Brevundimonas sp.]|uniref:pentapeptide repeat-containing protein n=1 Tax=Brevundimonas sp. TaxID=1871086 RepID=UPI003568DF8C